MSDQTILWRRLRLMPNAGTVDDPDWRGTGITPQSISALVGGTASNGVYSITIVGIVTYPGGNTREISEVVTMTRTTETNAQIASALEANADANASLVAAGIIASVSSATVTFAAPPGAALTFTASAPGTGTITFPSGSTLPIVASSPNYGGSRYSLGGIILQVNALNSSGVLLPPGTGTQTTVDITLVELCLYRNPNGVFETRIASTATLVDCNLAREYTFPIRGAGYWTARLSSFADPVASTAFYEVLYRDAIT